MAPDCSDGLTGSHRSGRELARVAFYKISYVQQCHIALHPARTVVTQGDIMLIKKTALAVLALALVTAPTYAPAKEAEAVKVQSKGAFKGASRIAIAAFNVGFIFESTDQTKKTGGMLGAFGGTTKAKSTLVGVTPAMMQQITDAAYADFVAQMSAKGITVMAPAALFGDPNFARVKTRPGPTEINISWKRAARARPISTNPAPCPRKS